MCAPAAPRGRNEHHRHPATRRTQDESGVEYPLIVNGVPILQQYYAGKYVGVANLSFDDAGTLTAASGQSVPLGTYYSAAGEVTTGALTA